MPYMEQEQAPQSSYRDRLRIELDELKERADKLEVFLETSSTFHQLGTVEQEDLREQYVLMCQYQSILERRLARILNKN